MEGRQHAEGNRRRFAVGVCNVAECSGDVSSVEVVAEGKVAVW